MVSCLMGDSTALASAIVRCCLKNRETADKLFFILAVIVSVVVVGFLALILFLN